MRDAFYQTNLSSWLSLYSILSCLFFILKNPQSRVQLSGFLFYELDLITELLKSQSLLSNQMDLVFHRTE